MSDTTNDIDALLAYMETVPRPDLRANLTALVAERDALRAELAAAIKERDEARRELCRMIGYQRQDRFDPKAIAAERGWKCFGEGGGA